MVYKNKKAKTKYLSSLFSIGWGGRIRTHEMEESESSALPLGDTPICDCFDY